MLKNAPYNPRKIDKRAREKLQKNLKTVGLVEPLTWNEATGNIVSGHQRVMALDALEGTQDYMLDVAVVHMDLPRERQQNVFMNNPTTQGDYDMTLLADLLKQGDFDKQAAGFDRLDLETVFTDQELAGMFRTDEATQSVLAELGKVGGVKPESPQRQPDGPVQNPDPELDPAEAEGDGAGPHESAGEQDSAATPHADASTTAQRRSDAVKEFMAGKTAGNDTETYAVVVFTTRREREIFMTACGQDPLTRYVDGARVFSKLGIDPDDGQWAQAYDEHASA